MTAINWTALLNLQAVRVATITKLDRGISSHRGCVFPCSQCLTAGVCFLALSVSPMRISRLETHVVPLAIMRCHPPCMTFASAHCAMMPGDCTTTTTTGCCCCCCRAEHLVNHSAPLELTRCLLFCCPALSQRSQAHPGGALAF